MRPAGAPPSEEREEPLAQRRLDRRAHAAPRPRARPPTARRRSRRAAGAAQRAPPPSSGSVEERLPERDAPGVVVVERARGRARAPARASAAGAPRAAGTRRRPGSAAVGARARQRAQLNRTRAGRAGQSNAASARESPCVPQLEGGVVGHLRERDELDGARRVRSGGGERGSSSTCTSGRPGCRTLRASGGVGPGGRRGRSGAPWTLDYLRFTMTLRFTAPIATGAGGGGGAGCAAGLGAATAAADFSSTLPGTSGRRQRRRARRGEGRKLSGPRRGGRHARGGGGPASVDLDLAHVDRPRKLAPSTMITRGAAGCHPPSGPRG